MKYKFKLAKDGNVFTVTTPDGIVTYDDAISTLQNYEPYQVLFYETIHDEPSTGKGIGGWFSL